MIEDGCLDGVDIIYGAHVMSTEPIGTFSVKEGYFSSAQDDFNITIRGKGGHGSEPHLTIDPLVTGSQLVMNLQQLVSRHVSPQHPAVVTVGSFHSGDLNNIIPDTATINGTVRTYSEEARTIIEQAMERITRTTCEGAGAGLDYEYVRDCPSIWNDPKETERVAKVATSLFGSENTKLDEPMNGSEDFAFYQKEIPGVYFIVGGGNPEIDATYPHHHPKFNIDERSIKDIAKMFVSVVFDYLNDEE